MSLRSFRKDEIDNLDIETYMRSANYHDVLDYSPHIFDVACLLRESTEKEDQKKAYEVQKKMILDLIEKTPHFRLDENNIYGELKSGRHAEGRAAFQLMCRRATEHKFKIVVIDAVSRLARNTRELFDVVDDFRKLGIGFLIVKGEYWTYNMNPNDIIKMAIEAGLAHAESVQTGERVKAHMGELAKSQLLGGNMFGYRLKKAVERKDNTLVIEPKEAYTIKLIFTLYASDNPDEVLTSSSICKYLIENKYLTFEGNLLWTPSKVIRVLNNTKYMGYQLPCKSEVDINKGKRVNLHVEPIRDEYDSVGNLVKAGNLVKGNWEPIVDEELWWKAYERRQGRSTKGHIKVNGRHSGLRVSNDAYARKAFCSCGYCLSREYVHTSKDGKEAQFRYKCRWQIMNTNKYTKVATLLEKGILCDNPAVSEMKLWLSGKKVFEYIFKNGKAAVLQTIELIERHKDLLAENEESIDVSALEQEKSKLQKRILNCAEMRADGEITANQYKDLKDAADKRLAEIEDILYKNEVEKQGKEKKAIDLDAIKERLNTFIDYRGNNISSEAIDMFVERIIYRGVVNGNDELLWEMNLSGDVVDTSSKYRIRGYDQEYADYLKSDKDFMIIASFIIPIEECKKYCTESLGRRYVPKFWRPITVKIALKQ